MQLWTRWGRDLDPDDPLPEHPRPRLTRAAGSWRSLNGRWSYAFGTEERPATWDGEIVVPFSPEAPLSGVGRQLQPDEWLWYRRTGIALPDAHRPGDRVLLHFGAVDQSCTVWVGGTEVGRHTGGYLPFTLDVTEALVEGPRTVEVRVRDLSETGPHARGKQRLDRGRIWYTAQSGIWQTVWLEVVPAVHVTSVDAVADVAAGTLTVRVGVAGVETGAERLPPPAVRVTVQVLDRRFTGLPGEPITVVLPDPRPWTPADPYLHDLEVTCGEDRVASYAALREVGTGTAPDGTRHFTLNGERIQHVGVLDQGYWPDGLLTPPSDAAMVHDISAMKDLGFTVLRKHVKIEPLRWYHHCDRLGMLVWQDMVNGGGRYRELTANLPARYPVRLSDRRYDLFFRGDADARAEFLAEVAETVALLRGTACVAVWTPFNEAWGQFDANAVADLVRTLDPTRPVNHVSGWIDQGGGDVKSHHSYLRPFRLPRARPWWRPWRREQRVRALTEYGGYSLRSDEHDWSSEEFGYLHCATPAELAAGFVALHREQIEPAIAAGLAATVYTQVSDVEDELNGLLTWDRAVLKIPAEVVRETLDRLRGAVSR